MIVVPGSRTMGPILVVNNGYYDGDWKNVETCPAGSYAAGFRMKVTNV